MNGINEPGFSLPLQVERRLISALRGETAVRTLTAEESQSAAKRLIAESRGFAEIDRAMRKHKLLPMVSRARGYTPFSRTTARTKLLAVVPYSSPEKASDLVGGIGLAEGEPASGVIVQLADQQVVRFSTFDLLAGKFITRDFRREELLEASPDRLREDLERGEALPAFDSTLSSAIAVDAFQVLLFDEHSRAVHTPDDQNKMLQDLPLISSIAELQYLRLQGLSASPDTSCCCCCCCCWGSCSSCA